MSASQATHTITLNGTTSSLTFAGTVTNTSGAAQTLTVNGTGNTLTLGGYALSNSATSQADIINGSGNVTITGAVTNGASSNSSLTYSGTGTLNLTTYNTYTGGTTVTSRTLILSTGTNIGDVRGTLTIGPNGTVNTSASNALGYAGVGYQVTTININGGLLNDTAVGDQGWGQTVNVTGPPCIP